MNGRRQQVLTAATLGINIAHRNDPTGTRARTLISALGAEVSWWARRMTEPRRPDLDHHRDRHRPLFRKHV